MSSTAEAASASAAQQAAAGALGLRYQFAYSDEEVEDLPASTSASASASEATGRPPAPGSRAEALLRLANKIGGARGAGAGGAGAGAAGGRTPAGAPELELESFDAVEGDVRAELAPLIARPATGVSSAPAARQQQQRQEQQTLQSAAAQICARGGQQDLPSPTKDDDEADEDAMGEPAQDVSFDDSQDWGDNTSVRAVMRTGSASARVTRRFLTSVEATVMGAGGVFLVLRRQARAANPRAAAAAEAWTLRAGCRSRRACGACCEQLMSAVDS